MDLLGGGKKEQLAKRERERKQRMGKGDNRAEEMGQSLRKSFQCNVTKEVSLASPLPCHVTVFLRGKRDWCWCSWRISQVPEDAITIPKNPTWPRYHRYCFHSRRVRAHLLSAAVSFVMIIVGSSSLLHGLYYIKISRVVICDVPQVNVSQQNSVNDEQVTVKTLAKGDWFGEQALKGWSFTFHTIQVFRDRISILHTLCLTLISHLLGEDCQRTTTYAYVSRVALEQNI